MSESHSRRQPAPAVQRLIEALAVAALTLAYLWPFRLYGFDVVDEGMLLAQLEWVTRGGRPYVDFETGYTPGFFAFYEFLWRATGSDLVASRTFGVCLHAATAALLYVLAAQRAGRRIGVAVVLLQVGFLLPVALRFGAHFNVPYPGWLGVPLVLLAQAAAAAHVRGARPGVVLIVGGLAAGTVFSIKPSVGVLTLGAIALAAPLAWSARPASALLLSAVLRSAAVLATLVLLGPGLDAGYLGAIVVPIAVAAWVARPASAAPESAHPLRDLLLLGAGFLLPVLPWLLPLFLELGLERVAREVLLLDGGGVVASYLLPYPLPAPATIVFLAGLAAAAVVAWSEQARFAPLALGLALLAAAPFAAGEPRLALENALHWLGPSALLAGFAVARSADRAVIVFAAIQLVQMFPRPDLIHLTQIGPPLLLAGAVTWHSFACAWRRRVPDAAQAERLARAVLAGVALLALIRLAPSLAGRLLAPPVPLPGGERGRLEIAPEFASRFAWLGELVGEIERRTERGEAVFAFPDLSGAVFLAGRSTPFYYLYFVPGRPDRRGEARALADLERVAPALAVVGSPRVPAFAGADSYFTGIVHYLARSYREVARGEDYRVLEREGARAKQPVRERDG